MPESLPGERSAEYTKRNPSCNNYFKPLPAKNQNRIDADEAQILEVKMIRSLLAMPQPGHLLTAGCLQSEWRVRALCRRPIMLRRLSGGAMAHGPNPPATS